jgi:hypothetical protein
VQQHQQLQQAKLARDLQKSVLAFQNVQKRSAERQRHFVDRAKAELTDTAALCVRTDSSK